MHAIDQPSRVILELLPNGKKRVLLAKDIVPFMDGEDPVGYVYKEAVFYLPDERNDSISDIDENFDAWWAYAAEEHNPPSLEDRVSVLEDVVALLMEV